MQKVFDLLRLLKVGITCDDPIDQQELPEIPQDILGFLFKFTGQGRFINLAQRFSQGGQHLVVKGHGPGTAKMIPHGRIRGLQRIIPIAMTIRFKRGALNQTGPNQFQGASDMLSDAGFFRFLRIHIKKRNLFPQEGDITGCKEVLTQRQQGPENDVSM